MGYRCREAQEVSVNRTRTSYYWNRKTGVGNCVGQKISNEGNERTTGGTLSWKNDALVSLSVTAVQLERLNLENVLDLYIKLVL